MEIKVSTENGRVPITVVHIEGNLDSASQMAFQTKMEELIKGGARYILVDLAHVPYVSSAGLRVINAIFNQLRSLHPDANLTEEEIHQGVSAGTYASPHLKLLNLTELARKSFESAGFDMYIETFTDFKTAIASF